MRAATVVEYNKPLQILNIPIPTPSQDQILVKVTACSLCNSDLAGWLGVVGAVAPYCPGHEPVGVIESVGSAVRGFKKGDRAGFMPSSFTCKDCNECQTGNHRFCNKKTSVGFQGPYGGFSQYAVADPLSTVKIPDALSDEVTAPLLCAGVTAYGALRKVPPGVQSVNVIGCGGVGHLVIQYAKALGYYVRGFDVNDKKLGLAARSGADETFYSTDATHADQASATIVATGAVAAYKAAFAVTANHGRIIAIGVPKGEIPVSLLDMVKRDLSLVATNQGSKEELEEALEIAVQHQIAPEYEIRQLDQLNDGFQEMMKGESHGRLVYRLW
ncbi:hypothetical protein ASPWEDRAFT_173995 [Aspergillus wentii DTO 134E9]|uniref:Enoyl reductase (ER) domain-containing protein n=1 Tax=Aspergillus wentii DTO 134E9 TaxID=1073089 RepID=A0A1L9RIA0_ASPWE|nr:uncharacterized protein ASPWEDRAFT_173995 [Aspergillus wentii DTO 134E9]KAI9925905.1 hypothetical protein MW887_005711 [Aspergillus wentii]OJJ34588.1 hypothetical protein ASPWEDRAFT_173995 [Aspergillus wentii DTO 134E9]